MLPYTSCSTLRRSVWVLHTEIAADLQKRYGVSSEAAIRLVAAASAVAGSIKDAKNPNFSIGQGTLSEANQLGKTWVGEGATKTSDGFGLISEDGTRVYWPPTLKDSSFATTGVQANFEMYKINPVTGQRVKVSNGHLNVAD